MTDSQHALASSGVSIDSTGTVTDVNAKTYNDIIMIHSKKVLVRIQPHMPILYSL
jgi:hypothetical protein